LTASNTTIGTQFPESFGIDGRHDDEERAEAFLGWISTTREIRSDNFALDFWMLMGKGMTVTEAVNYLKELDSHAGYLRYNSNNLSVFKEGGNPTLVP
jgi:hypothetical protein